MWKSPGGGGGGGGGGGLAASSASVHNSGVISIANNTFVAPAWDTKDFDTLGTYWSAGTPDRFTIPVTGQYLVTGAAAFAANATGNRIVGFFKNLSTAILYGGSTAPTSSGTNQSALCATYIYSLSAGDTVQFAVFQSSGAGLNMAGNFVSFFAICRVG